MSYCTAIETMPEERKALHKAYHDFQYGFPIHDDNELFCRLVLEINQAGLSWELILKKQERFRKAYANFDIKKVAAYHQYYAVNKAVESTVIASGRHGDRRGGVIWHTQGSGKSLSMVFFSGKLIIEPRMENPTLVILTDRNDLDEQLHETFTNCQQLLRQEPQKAEDRIDLRILLNVASGGIVFTTIQKFMPMLMLRILSFMLFTEALKLTKKALKIKLTCWS